MGRWKTAALAVFVVLAVGFGIFRWRAGANLDAAKQRVRDAGYPVTYAELDEFYALPESGENRAYLLQFAIDSIVAPSRKLEENLPISGSADLPHRSEPIPEEQVLAMRTFVLQNLDAVDAVFESFEYEECRFPIDVNVGPAMQLGHLAQIRTLARRLSIRSLLASLNGDTEAATKMLVGTIELADSLEQEPILISQLVRIAIYGIGLSAFEQAMNRADFSAEQLETMQKRLVEAEKNRAFVNGFIGERCMWTVVERMGWDDKLFGSGGGGFDPQDLWFDLVYRPFGLMELDGVRYYDAFEQIMAACEMPVSEQIDAAQAISDRLARNGGVGSMTAIIMPSLARALEADVRNRAHLRTVILALAAARYKADKGEYPDTADMLVPDYLDAVPIDPCGGDPIRYRRLDHGFVAYSLGRNRTDEGGEEDEDQHVWMEGDLTFTIERED